MIKLIQFLISGCWHEWEIIKYSDLHWSNDFGERGTGTRYILRCKKCGLVRKKDIK
jgi:hypothetical protein